MNDSDLAKVTQLLERIADALEDLAEHAWQDESPSVRTPRRVGRPSQQKD